MYKVVILLVLFLFSGCAHYESNTSHKEVNIQPLIANQAQEELFQKGIDLYQSHQYEKAKRIFTELIEQAPLNYKAYSAKGVILALEGSYDEGLNLIQYAYTLKPDYVPTYYDMAIAYKLQGNLTEAKVWFTHTVEKDPNNTWSYYGIATIYADQGNKREALTYLQKAINLDSSVKQIAREQDHFSSFHGEREFEHMTR